MACARKHVCEDCGESAVVVYACGDASVSACLRGSSDSSIIG